MIFNLIFFSVYKPYQKVALTISGINDFEHNRFVSNWLFDPMLLYFDTLEVFFFICYMLWLVLVQLFSDIIIHVLCDQSLGISYPSPP